MKKKPCYNQECKKEGLYKQGDNYYCSAHLPGSGVDTYREGAREWGAKPGDMGKL